MITTVARRVPKIELHVHLEGTVRRATLLRIARRNGCALPARTEPELTQYYRFTDFAHFLRVGGDHQPRSFTILVAEALIDDCRFMGGGFGCRV